MITYTIKTIDPFGFGSYAEGVNSIDQIVGRFWDSGRYQAFLYSGLA
jgi:hypothetical protein